MNTEDSVKDKEINKIKEKHPSICYSCDKARKPASDNNTKKGYVGCCLRVIGKRSHGGELTYDWGEIKEAKEIGEGWVDLKSEIKLGKGSGVITNFMLLTLEVKTCNQYSPKS
jgi:hypothetical protein